MSNMQHKREVKETEAPTDTLRRIVNILLSLAGFILVFRFVFLLFGANPDNAFVDLIYRGTEPYVGLFSGIFAESEMGSGVFEPATIIALVVLFIASWLIQSLFARRTVRREEYAASERTGGTSERTEGTGNRTVTKESTVKTSTEEEPGIVEEPEGPESPPKE